MGGSKAKLICSLIEVMAAAAAANTLAALVQPSPKRGICSSMGKAG